MVMVGASTEDLDLLAKRMGQSADDLTQQIRIPLRQLVGHSSWSGPDSTRFRHDWTSTLEPQLTKVAAALQSAEQTLRRNAQEQRDASSGSGSGGSSSGGSAGGGFVGGGGGGGGVWGWGDSADPSSASTSPAMTGLGILQKLITLDGAKVNWEVDRWFKGMSDVPDGVSWADYIKQGKALQSGGILDGIGTTVDGVAYVGAALELASGRGDWSDVVSLAGDGAELIGAAAKWGNAGGILKFAGPAGQILGIAADGVKAYEAAQNGDWLGAAYHGAHAAVRGVAIVNPAVGAGLAALDLGVAVGTAIASSPVVQQYTGYALEAAGKAAGDVAGAAAKTVNDVAGAAAKVAGDVGKAAGNVVNGAADALGGFVGGLFGKGKK